MTVYFFTRINQASRSAFRSFCTLQNLRTVKNISLVYFIINLSIRILGTFTNLPFNNINHVDELSRANMISTLTTPLFYLAAVLLIKYYERNRLVTKLGYVLVILFAMFVITNGMRVTFFAMHNPRNTLVMYLAALTLVGVFFTIEYYETFIIVAVTSIIFMLVIPTYQPGFSEQLLNNVVSFVLLTLFFCISRYLFSYRADNYLKLKAIEEKNVEIETASRLKNEILGIVAHDLRNPLTAIYTLAMIMEDDRTINAENQENLEMIKA
jgi:two-component system sensor histidine kinase VicK